MSFFLLCHLVSATKYWQFVLGPKVDRILKRACLDIRKVMRFIFWDWLWPRWASFYFFRTFEYKV